MRYLFGYGYLALAFFLVTVLKRLFFMRAELSRKLLHILIGYTYVILYDHFILPENVSPYELLVMPISFILINYLSYRYRIFDIMERDGEDNHPGTVYYAIAVTLLMAGTILFPVTVIPSGIAIFALSLGDGFAAIFGTLFGKYGPRIGRKKSLIGSLACLIGAVGGIYLLMLFVPFSFPFYAVLALGAVTALCELMPFGLDNFTILFGVTAAATLFMEVLL